MPLNNPLEVYAFQNPDRSISIYMDKDMTNLYKVYDKNYRYKPKYHQYRYVINNWHFKLIWLNQCRPCHLVRPNQPSHTKNFKEWTKRKNL